ncbi:hypothetical protein [Thalassococcus lentus]|uniref:Colicin transporter n=1 Tax=Thalassococcus lentus TaxID=1210524 RepID=A0ABT4XR64_9RHOB|nr:hypothetical protein [Thalassococcus lentus]MDA7424446.1 hypothetical protein [Thalassococcus lentus]
MSQLDDLQGRITQALDRVTRAVDKWEPSVSSQELEALKSRAAAAEAEAAAATAAAAAAADAMAEAEAARDAAPVPDPSLAQTSAFDVPSSGGADVEALQLALEDEKLANAQLEERLKALRGRIEEETAGLREQVESQREAMAQLDSDLQRLRTTNESLRQTNADLREANAKGVGEPHLINKAMLTELEALRATRSAEAAEAKLVLGAVEAAISEADEQEQVS